MHLLIGERRIRLAQVSTNFVVLETHADLPAGPAELEIDIDNSVRRASIVIRPGSGQTGRVGIEMVGQLAPRSAA